MRIDSGALTLDQRGSECSRQCSRLMFDKMANGLDPAPDVGDIVANRFGLEMSGKRAHIGGRRRLVREHGCSLYQSIPKDGLDSWMSLARPKMDVETNWRFNASHVVMLSR